MTDKNPTNTINSLASDLNNKLYSGVIDLKTKYVYEKIPYVISHDADTRQTPDSLSKYISSTESKCNYNISGSYKCTK